MAPKDPRSRLDALAAAGRAQREAAEAASRLASRQEEAAALAALSRHERLMSWTTWSSLSRCMSLVLWAPFPPIAAVFAVEILKVADPTWIFRALATSGAFLLIAVLGALWARSRDIAFRARLPFSTAGYTAILGTPARSVTCTIEFAGSPPPVEMFADLLRPLRGPTTLVESSGSTFQVEGHPVDYSILDEHCRWLPRWFRKFNKKVLAPVHAVYPIRALTFR